MNINVRQTTMSVDEAVVETMNKTRKKAERLLESRLKDDVLAIEKTGLYTDQQLAFALVSMAYGLLRRNLHEDDANPEFDILAYFAREWVKSGAEPGNLQ